MLLNRFEFVLMNNPVRALIQRHVEARRLVRMGGRMISGATLEIGGGGGVGLGIVLDDFQAACVDGFDLDPRIIARAPKRLAARRTQCQLWVGDASQIAAADAAYDAVFDFGVLHHILNWPAAVAEIARVLKPGGRLYGEEVLARFLERRLIRRLFVHPKHDRFDAPELRATLENAGFTVNDWEEWRNSFAWFVADKPA